MIPMTPNKSDSGELDNAIDEILLKHEENRFANGDINNRKFTKLALKQALTTHIQAVGEENKNQFTLYTGETINLCNDCPQFKVNGAWEIRQCNSCQRLTQYLGKDKQ